MLPVFPVSLVPQQMWRHSSSSRFPFKLYQQYPHGAIQVGSAFLFNALEKQHHSEPNSTLETSTDFVLILCGSVLVLLLFWQAARTGLHGNRDAHATASQRHLGDARPFISFWTVTLDAGQEAVLVKTSWKETHTTCLMKLLIKQLGNCSTVVSMNN